MSLHKFRRWRFELFRGELWFTEAFWGAAGWLTTAAVCAIWGLVSSGVERQGMWALSGLCLMGLAATASELRTTWRHATRDGHYFEFDSYPVKVELIDGSPVVLAIDLFVVIGLNSREARSMVRSVLSQ